MHDPSCARRKCHLPRIEHGVSKREHPIAHYMSDGAHGGSRNITPNELYADRTAATKGEID